MFKYVQILIHGHPWRLDDAFGWTSILEKKSIKLWPWKYPLSHLIFLWSSYHLYGSLQQLGHEMMHGDPADTLLIAAPRATENAIHHGRCPASPEGSERNPPVMCLAGEITISPRRNLQPPRNQKDPTGSLKAPEESPPLCSSPFQSPRRELRVAGSTSPLPRRGASAARCAAPHGRRGGRSLAAPPGTAPALRRSPQRNAPGAKTWRAAGRCVRPKTAMIWDKSPL